LFASLLGTSFIPEDNLGSFYWNLLGPDHPLAKVQVGSFIFVENSL